MRSHAIPFRVNTNRLNFPSDGGPVSPESVPALMSQVNQQHAIKKNIFPCEIRWKKQTLFFRCSNKMYT